MAKETSLRLVKSESERLNPVLLLGTCVALGALAGAYLATRSGTLRKTVLTTSLVGLGEAVKTFIPEQKEDLERIVQSLLGKLKLS